MATLDASIANTALPTIARELHATPAASVWVVNGFQLAVTMTLLSFASLGDSRGISFVYRIGIVIFTIGSLLCALANSLEFLIAARVVQGIGGAATMAIGPALYREIFPQNQFGKALGISAVIVATGAAAGPTVGGTILHFATWPWLFAINVPLGIFDIFFSRVLPKTTGTGVHLDIPSIILSALGFGALIYGIDGFARHEPISIIVGEVSAGLLAGYLFIRRTQHLVNSRPLIALDLFHSPTFSLAAVTATATYVGQGLAFVSLPYYFQAALGKSPFESGLLLSSWPIAVMIVAPIAGRLSDKYPAGILSTIGLAILALGLGLYATVRPGASALEILLHGAICGIGFGFFQSPNNRELIGSAPRNKAGSAAGVLASVRLTGQTTGAAGTAIVFGAIGASVAAGHDHAAVIVLTATPITLWLGCAVALIGITFSAFRLLAKRPKPMPAPE
jgi:DHA2 family multidrug resistance protein-like MFS transporter